ncbi:MAG: VWA domain-containing protein [Planctomycetes bacterium]|nr:VWA domain-containing protein [Planctomycetota bacterium]
MRSAFAASFTFLATSTLVAPAFAADGLEPIGKVDRTLELRDHHVEVVIQDGFARTEVTQTWFNPNGADCEAWYEFPVPRDASLGEMSIFAGETLLQGEVVAKEQAQQVYEEERSAGRDAGLAEQNSFLTWRFRLARVPANAETKCRFAYYEPLEIDTGVGRYLYPLEPGGTDDAAQSFWSGEAIAERSFSFHALVRSAAPIDRVRLPGFEKESIVATLPDGDFDVRLDAGRTALARDVVLYWRLIDGLPGRIDVIPYRADAEGSGTFMVVVTPGVDLQPLVHGADYSFVLDVSGSMQDKLAALVDGVSRALGELRDHDRFRLVTFNTSARELTSGWVAATRPNVEAALAAVKGLRADGSTNLYEGIRAGLADLDDDRATSVVLVTDAVANQGEVRPEQFAKLLSQHDLRLFGFLLGNSGNWPLMRTICDASGGFYAGVSNSDDLMGQIALAKSKVTHECLHAAKLTVRGKGIHDTSRELLGKVFYGQQLVMFGRYDRPGEVEIALEARLTGQDQTYRTKAHLPALAVDHPELERLWALNQVSEAELQRDRGQLDNAAAAKRVRELGLMAQIVTDETSMVVADDAAFARHGIARDNRDRVATEHRAQQQRAAQPVQSYRVDPQQPAFPAQAPSTGGKGGKGGGAMDWSVVALAGLLAALTLRPARKGARGSSTLDEAAR